MLKAGPIQAGIAGAYALSRIFWFKNAVTPGKKPGIYTKESYHFPSSSRLVILPASLTREHIGNLLTKSFKSVSKTPDAWSETTFQRTDENSDSSFNN